MGTTSNFDFGTPGRRTSPNLTLPNGGNDETMQGILKQGAPKGSTGGVMFDSGMTPGSGMPMFGQSPAAAPGASYDYRTAPPAPTARSGGAPVMPMFSSSPAAAPSRMNHSYDAGMGFGSGLAGRGATAVGRSMKNAPQRRFETAARYGNLRAAGVLLNLRQNQDQGQGQGAAAGPPANMMFQPEQPSGHFEPGRSTGSQVWVRDGGAAAAAPAAPEAAAPAWNGDPAQLGGGGVKMFGTDQGASAAPAPKWNGDPATLQIANSLPWDGKGPLPPSVLGGGSGVPPPPAVAFKQIPGTNHGVPVINGEIKGNTLPMDQTAAVPKPEEIAKHIQGMGSNGVQATYGPKGWTYGPRAKGDTVKVVNDQGKVVDFPADHELPGGWQPLQKKGESAAGAPAPNAGGAPATGKPGAVQGKSPGGVQYQLKTQADTATGQLPNDAYANDLTPQQSLEAAHADYLKTGNDAKLREHFQAFPSQASQYLQQEQAAWNQVGEATQSGNATHEAKVAAMQHRDNYLQKHNYLGPVAVGAYAKEWEGKYPKLAAALNDRTTNPNQQAELMARASRLNAQYVATKTGQKVAPWEEDPGRTSPPPVASGVKTAPQHPLRTLADVLSTAGEGVRMFGSDTADNVKKSAKDLAAYGKSHPITMFRKD